MKQKCNELRQEQYSMNEKCTNTFYTICLKMNLTSLKVCTPPSQFPPIPPAASLTSVTWTFDRNAPIFHNGEPKLQYHQNNAKWHEQTGFYHPT